MLRLAIIAGTLTLSSAACAAAQSVEDARAVAFRDDCAKSLADLTGTIERVKAAGWVQVDPTSHPEMKALYDISMSAGIDGMSVEAFSRNVGDAQLHMMISGGVPTQAGKANGCYVYDFNADAFSADPDVGGVIETWMGEPPSESTNQRGLISQKKWVGPTAHPQFASVRVASVPAGSAAGASVQFSGAAWSATAFAN